LLGLLLLLHLVSKLLATCSIGFKVIE